MTFMSLNFVYVSYTIAGRLLENMEATTMCNTVLHCSQTLESYICLLGISGAYFCVNMAAKS